MAPFRIRIVGDPVLRGHPELTDIDGRLVKLVGDMFDTMYATPTGIGLAAPQVGVQKRFFVYDMTDGEDPRVLINPRITGTDGEWTYDEGCLSIPGVHFTIVRPKTIEVSGLDLDGNEVSFEADELLSRLVQHELDHLDGVLMTDRLDEDQARDARRIVREIQMSGSAPPGAASPDPAGELRLP